MKKSLIVFIILFLIVVSVLFAQESEERSIGSFRGIKSSEAIDVYLKKGDKESIKVEVNGTKLSNVITEVSGSTLRIHMQSGNYRERKNVKVYVTYVSLDRISASSASNVFSTGTIKATNFDISVSSAASVEVSLEAVSTSLSASSAAEIVLQGKTKLLEVEASSAADINCYDFGSETVNANASSAGDIKVSVTKDFDAHASSGGSVRYRGNPSRSNTGSSSGGSVKKSNG
jgi:uncharacterized protein YaiE (UPF0345 family)